MSSGPVLHITQDRNSADGLESNYEPGGRKFESAGPTKSLLRKDIKEKSKKTAAQGARWTLCPRLRCSSNFSRNADIGKWPRRADVCSVCFDLCVGPSLRNACGRAHRKRCYRLMRLSRGAVRSSRMP